MSTLSFGARVSVIQPRFVKVKALQPSPVTPVQETSFGESVSTLGFGARVSEVCLGAAKRNCESGAVFEAKETARRQEREAERAGREVRGDCAFLGRFTA